jgi:phosphotriesterase-related protein
MEERMTIDRVGKVQTVLGLIEPEQVGTTLMHEHLLIDLQCRYAPQPGEAGAARGDQPFTIRDRVDILSDPTSRRDNLRLLEESVAIDEVLEFKKAGGATLVDTTTSGIGRDPEALKRISMATGLNVTMGAGYYAALTHPADMDALSEDAIYERIVREVQEGVDGTGIRCGHIGEIGVDTMAPNEMKVVRAAARAQRTTGAMLNIHQLYLALGREGHKIADAIEAAGGDLGRTVFSHMDGSENDFEYQSSLIARGVTIEFDVFGLETYWAPLDVEFPRDTDRIRAIKHLFDMGLGERVLVSQDICMKMQMERYGGWGYGHIVKRVVPRFRRAGLGDQELETLLVRNPRRLLTFAAPK